MIFEYKGVEYTLSFSIDALEKAEKLTGGGYLNLLNYNITLDNLMRLVYSSLTTDNSSVKDDYVTFKNEVKKQDGILVELNKVLTQFILSLNGSNKNVETQEGKTTKKKK